MTKREKVIKGLECHYFGFCFACPYDDDVISTENCKRNLVREAIDILKHPGSMEQPAEEVKQ